MMPAKAGEIARETGGLNDAETLRRRALWFREFARLGALEDRIAREAVADSLDRQRADHRASDDISRDSVRGEKST